MDNNTNPSNQFSQQPVSSPSQAGNVSTNHSSWIKIVLMLVIIILVGAIGTILFQTYQANQESEEVSIPKAPIKEVSPTTAMDETTGWEIGVYFDITFKYPKPLRLIEPSSEGEGLVLSFSKTEIYPGIVFHSYNNPSNLGVKEFNDSEQWTINPGLYSETSEEKEISGILGFYQKGINCEPPICDRFAISYNGKVYEINNIYDDNSPKSQRETFTQILSTFQFTE